MEKKFNGQSVEKTTMEFSSKSEEIQHLKSKLKILQARNDELERELQEYHEHSQVYEFELESSCEKSEKKISNLQLENTRLINELENLKDKNKRQSSSILSSQTRIQELSAENGQLIKSVRKLEQENDKFEKEIRETKVAVEEMEKDRDLALEKMALLETELEQFEDLKVKFQRLKDENTDLKQQYQADLRKLQENINNSCVTIHSNESNNFASIGNCTVVEVYPRSPQNSDEKIVSYENAHNESRDREEELQARVDNETKSESKIELDMAEKEERKQDSFKKPKATQVVASEPEGAKSRKSKKIKIKSRSFRDGKQVEDDKKKDDDKNKDEEKRSTFGTLLRRLRHSASWKKNN